MPKTIRITLAFLLSWFLLFSSIVSIAGTAAGTRIQNQASATYRFVGDDTVRTATSNLVTTLIQQVAGIDLLQDGNKYAAAGYEVYFPHVVTNMGNDVDTFTLLAVDESSGDSIDFETIRLYSDSNHDGQPDDLNRPITSTPALGQDEKFYFIVGAKVADSALATQTAKLTLTATSQFDNNHSQINTDTATVTDQAVIDAFKSMSHKTGESPSTGYTVTLTYQNRSQNLATAVTLMDDLPAGMSYVPGSAVWSVDNTLVLTDIAGDKQGTGGDLIDLCSYDATCTGADQSATQFTAILDQVAANAQGWVRFEVSIDAGLDAGTLQNTARYKYNDGSAVIAAVNTNTVPFDVSASYGVAINGSSTDSTLDAGESITVASTPQGSVFMFENVVWNLGNSTDSFDLSIDYDTASMTFPAGTRYEILRADAATPATDTSNNGVVDTGLLEPGESVSVFIRVTLPNTVSGDNGGAGYQVMTIATSSTDNTLSDTALNQLNEIVPSAVDMTLTQAAGVAGAVGEGVTVSPTALETVTVAPGESGVFPLYVKNTQVRSDSYTLSYNANSSFGASAGLPANWSVKFFFDGGNADCSTFSHLTTATGTIGGGAYRLMCAQVNVPTNQAVMSAPQSIYFRALSPTTNSADILHTAVSVAAQVELQLTPEHKGQVEAGQATVYTHEIVNGGNASLEGVTVSATNNVNGWVSVIYLDTDNDKKFTGADAAYTPQQLLAGERKTVFVRVLSPQNVTDGSSNVTMVSAVGYMDDGDGNPATLTGTQLNASVQDLTTVGSVRLDIVKEQALDANCDGTVDGPNSCSGDACFTKDAFSVGQGQCVIYRLTAHNSSSGTVRNVKISDMAPMFTSFYTTSGYPQVSHGNVTAVTHGDDGDIVGGSVDGVSVSLTGGETMTLEFVVRLD